MSFKTFINKFLKIRNAKSIQKENERLQIKSRVLDKLKEELKQSHSNKRNSN